MANKVFSKCGNRCDLCLIYRPNVMKDDRRKEICQVYSKVELVQKIDIEKRWTWEDEKLMEAYSCKKNMDEFKKSRNPEK